MKAGTTFLESRQDGKLWTVGYDYKKEYGFTEILKINYIQRNGIDIDPQDYDEDSIQMFLETFFNLNDASDIAQEYFDRLQHSQLESN